MNKKKLLTLALTLSMVAILAIGTTIAYFNEAETQTNVFSVANLEIDLWENASFKDGADNDKADPGENLGKDTDENPGYTYEAIIPGDKMNKEVHVENKDNTDVYVTLAIRQDDYLDFNRKIDDHYEAKTVEELKALLGYEGDATKDDLMQMIIDAIFTGKSWDISYTKADANSLRYEMIDPAFTLNGAELVGLGYANSSQSATGTPHWNYNGDFFTCQKGYTESDMDGNFDTIPVNNNEHIRMWLVYLKLPAGASFTADLSTTCPTFVTTENIEAFDGMKLDIQAAAIQAEGFEDADAAFTELHEIWGFDYNR